MSTDWADFPALPPRAQAGFLLGRAKAAWERASVADDIDGDVVGSLDRAERVLDGRTAELPDLIRFIEDPEGRRDFAAYTERLAGDEPALAALDLVSYACAFIARIVAEASDHEPLPDAVIEAVPEVHGYFRDRDTALRSM